MITLVDEDSRIARLAALWLGEFERAVSNRDSPGFAALFAADACWRDLLAFTGDLRTASGREAIARQFACAPGQRTFLRKLGSPRTEVDTRFHRGLILVFFEFESERGRGDGVARLLMPADGAAPTAWTLLTALRSLPDEAARRAPATAVPARDSGNWLQMRREELGYEGRDPAVLIVGAGQSGLSIAARLKAAGVDALVIERSARIGDNWRTRYESLRLHNQKWANHLPLVPFPETWPVYIPKDQLANWFEFYAEALELNVWTEAEFLSGTFNESSARWTATVRRPAGERQLHPRHLVLATGVSGQPRTPSIAGIQDYRGTVLHSSSYDDGARYHAVHVLVVGTGTSAHDIAQDLQRNGAHVTMMQRGATTVVSLEPSAELAYGLYRENRSTEECDLINLSIPYPRKCQLLRRLAVETSALDRELLARLHAVGFRTDLGEDGTGFQMKYLRRGGGYYIDIGCSELIASGRITLIQASEFVCFTPDGIRLADGSEQRLDAVVLATGYETIQETVRRLLGPAVADRVGQVWGLDDQGELRNVCRPTAQPGLWFMVGGLVESRMLSPFLALQIQAAESGVRL